MVEVSCFVKGRSVAEKSGMCVCVCVAQERERERTMGEGQRPTPREVCCHVTSCNTLPRSLFSSAAPFQYIKCERGTHTHTHIHKCSAAGGREGETEGKFGEGTSHASSPSLGPSPLSAALHPGMSHAEGSNSDNRAAAGIGTAKEINQRKRSAKGQR